MSTKTEPSFYSRKHADINQLVEFINGGDTESKVELQHRLQAEAKQLLRLYSLAYGDTDTAQTKLTADLVATISTGQPVDEGPTFLDSHDPDSIEIPTRFTLT